MFPFLVPGLIALGGGALLYFGRPSQAVAAAGTSTGASPWSQSWLRNRPLPSTQASQVPNIPGSNSRIGMKAMIGDLVFVPTNESGINALMVIRVDTAGPSDVQGVVVGVGPIKQDAGSFQQVYFEPPSFVGASATAPRNLITAILRNGMTIT